MTRILIADHGRASLALAVALLDRSDFVVLGTGSVTIKTDAPDLPAFNWPAPEHFAPPCNTGRRVAQWKSERKGRRS